MATPRRCKVSVTLGVGATSAAVSLPAGMSSSYQVDAEFGYDMGSWWVTDKTSSGFVLHVATGPGSSSTVILDAYGE